MINETIKLTGIQKFEMFFEEKDIDPDYVIVKPTYMSICAADQRYYQGKRKKEVLNKKLPLTLIHEAVGRVIYDPKGEFAKEEKVVLIPNTPQEDDEIIKENYRRSSLFRSSNYDGFMQKKCFPESKIIVFGRNAEKLAYFSFVDETVLTSEMTDDMKVDHAFECIGGTGSENAIEEIIAHINPQGTINLLGVSEDPVHINGP